VRSLYDALNDRVLTAQASLATSGAKDDRRVGAQRHNSIVDILWHRPRDRPLGPPVPEPSFLTEEQIADLDKRAGTYAPSTADEARGPAAGRSTAAQPHCVTTHRRSKGTGSPAADAPPATATLIIRSRS